MLAGELKAFDAKVAAGQAPPPTQPPAQSALAPPSLAGLHVSKAPLSQSVPVMQGHLVGSFPPAKPRPRPSATGLSQLPILELPEPSPHSCSLLDDAPVQQGSSMAHEEDDDDFVGGTCALPLGVPGPPSLPQAAANPPRASARSPSATFC